MADVFYNDFRLTLVGTLKSNRKKIPEELKTTNGRQLYSSKFAFLDPSTAKPPVTLVSYITKDKPKKESHINLYYNSTKGEVTQLTK